MCGVMNRVFAGFPRSLFSKEKLSNEQHETVVCGIRFGPCNAGLLDGVGGAKRLAIWQRLELFKRRVRLIDGQPLRALRQALREAEAEAGRERRLRAR